MVVLQEVLLLHLRRVAPGIAAATGSTRPIAQRTPPSRLNPSPKTLFLEPTMALCNPSLLVTCWEDSVRRSERGEVMQQLGAPHRVRMKWRGHRHDTSRPCLVLLYDLVLPWLWLQVRSE